MANSIFGMIPGLGGSDGSGTALLFAMVWILIIVMFSIASLVSFFMILYLKRSTPCVEIDLVTHRVKTFRSTQKKTMKGVDKLFSRFLKKNLPAPQRKDAYVKGNKDMLILLKDNNGMHHTLRLPTFDDLKAFYYMKGIDITKEKIEDENGNEIDNPAYRNYEVFFLPNPHEDREWLANQCLEADKEFKWSNWWQHPNMVYIGCFFICFMMFVMTMIISKKM